MPQARRRTAVQGRWIVVSLLVIDGLIGCTTPEVPPIRFAPYGSGYASKPDFDDVEYRFPLSPADRLQITPETLADLDQEQLDQVYARLTAGAMPDGEFEGKVLVPRGTAGDERLARLAGPFGAAALELKGLALTDVTQILWRGKVFDREHRVLRNRIDDPALLRKLAPTGAQAKPVSNHGQASGLLFPAKVYCGQSLLDARRESIIADYAFADDVADYQEWPDYLVGRRGLNLREEMRMVRPGFYLGRAYADRVFVLNFALYDKRAARGYGERVAADAAGEEACWAGTQQRRAALLR